MRQRCGLAVSVAGIVLVLASCQRVGQLKDTLRELQQVQKEVSGLVDPSTTRPSLRIENCLEFCANDPNDRAERHRVSPEVSPLLTTSGLPLQKLPLLTIPVLYPLDGESNVELFI